MSSWSNSDFDDTVMTFKTRVGLDSLRVVQVSSCSNSDFDDTR